MRKPHYNTAKSASFRSPAKPAPVATLGTSQNLARAADSSSAPQTASTRPPQAKTPAPKPKRGRLFFAASMSVLTSAAGAVGYFEMWPKYICRQWESRAATATDLEVDFAVDRLEGCGTLGTIAMTRLLASNREPIARAAYTRLAATCRRFRNDGTGLSIDATDTATLEALATGLEELAHKFPHEVPAPVADFAWDVLEMTGKMSLEERAPMLARSRLANTSDQLLQRPVRPRAVVAVQPTPPKIAPKPAPDAAAQHRLEAQRTLASLYALPQPPTTAASETAPGGLPTAMPATPLPSVAQANSPQPMSAGVDVGPNNSVTQSGANAAARINPIRDGSEPSAIRQVSTAPSGGDLEAALTQPAAASAALQRHLTTRSAWNLLGDLQEPGTPQASAAAAELHRRGFSLREIEIGKHLTSSDAAERTRYTEMLPSAGIAVKPWLLYLSGDPDAEVRRAAVAIMATSNDPELRAKLRDLAITDPDETVRSSAAKSGRPATMRAPAGY